jgi:single-strand DNA-binding protein
MQQLNLVGYIGNDAEVKDLGKTQVINFSLAVTKKVKNERVTTWYKCAWFTNNVSLAPWLASGSFISVTGEPSVEAYIATDGTARATMKCIIKEITMYSSTKQKAPAPTTAPPPPPKEPEEVDDLPF